jgi:hypothetical protein
MKTMLGRVGVCTSPRVVPEHPTARKTTKHASTHHRRSVLVRSPSLPSLCTAWMLPNFPHRYDECYGHCAQVVLFSSFGGRALAEEQVVPDEARSVHRTIFVHLPLSANRNDRMRRCSSLLYGRGTCGPGLLSQATASRSRGYWSRVSTGRRIGAREDPGIRRHRSARAGPFAPPS